MKTIKQIQEENRVSVNTDPIDLITNIPLTISRVLLALGTNRSGLIRGKIVVWDSFGYKDICDWDLTKPTLEEQSEETQREINKLLNNDK